MKKSELRKIIREELTRLPAIRKRLSEERKYPYWSVSSGTSTMEGSRIFYDPKEAIQFARQHSLMMDKPLYVMANPDAHTKSYVLAKVLGNETVSLREMSPDAEVEKRRKPIGKKVIDNVRRNNPHMEEFERERLRKIDGKPEERNFGEF